MDEASLLNLRRRINERKVKDPDRFVHGLTGEAVRVGVTDETGFPHHAKVDFTDNHVDPDTGTPRVRAIISNTDHLLMPGLYARVRLETGSSYKALAVPAQVIV